MGEISTTGFKYLSVHKKLDLELERNMKKIDREVMKRRHTLYVQTESVRKDLHEMFKSAQNIDTVFGPEFTDDIANKVFPSLRKSSKSDEGAPKTNSYTLTQARNAMKELKKRKKREKHLQSRLNRIRKKSFTKRMSQSDESDERDLKLMIAALKNLNFDSKEEKELSLPQITVSDATETPSNERGPASRLGISKLSSRRWKALKISRELSLPIITKNRTKTISLKIPSCKMNDYVDDKSSEHDAENDRPKMPPRNSFDLSTLPAISLAKKNMAKDNKNPSQTDKKDEKPEEKESGFMISKYLSEVHGNLPEDILLEIEKMVKEESFILDK